MGNTSTKSQMDTNEHPPSSNPDWMKGETDDTPLNMITIPGTNRSMALQPPAKAQCQSWGLFDQLRAGIRFVDIGCRHIDDKLLIHNAEVYEKASLDEVLNEILRFLDSCPTETVLVRIRRELTEHNCTRNFEVTFNKYLDLKGKDRFRCKKKIPKMGKARGKIVFVQDFPGGTYGIPWSSFQVADKMVVTSDVTAKWNNIQNHLIQVKRSSDNSKMFVTVCSGSNASTTPRSVADRVNKKLHEFFVSHGGKVRWGVITMDYPGRELIQCIIDSNF